MKRERKLFLLGGLALAIALAASTVITFGGGGPWAHLAPAYARCPLTPEPAPTTAPTQPPRRTVPLVLPSPTTATTATPTATPQVIAPAPTGTPSGGTRPTFSMPNTGEGGGGPAPWTYGATAGALAFASAAFAVVARRRRHIG